MDDVEYARQVLYAGAGAMAWIAWDTIVHFDVEIECVWCLPNWWVKATYGFIRYLPIIHGGAVLTLGIPGAHFSSAGCRGWLYYELIFMEVLTFIVEVILVMRLYVLYNQNKVVLWLMILAFVAEIAMMVCTMALVLPNITFTPDCLVASAPTMFMAYWLSSLIFETFLFVLTLVKFSQSVSRFIGKQSIIFIFVRDGTWAFAIIFVAMLLNMLMYKLSTTPLVGMGYFWALAVLSFAGSHVLLNLRRLGLPERETGFLTTYNTDAHDMDTRSPSETSGRYRSWSDIAIATQTGTRYEMAELRHADERSS